MREYREILKKHNVTLLPAPASLDSNAWYVHDLKLLYVKDGLSDADFENVMLHEIKGHIDLEHELHELNDNIVQRRMEREANEIMTDKLI
ncbi:hypothetical protein ACNQ2Q_26350, partial [Enterobacter cloacae complex sp.6701430]|uniref:hypothetical protein n=1 Tax=Enterobacter cloacae complex sp.6701430 TaxID=3397176 RepID=UPI003AAB9E9B